MACKDKHIIVDGNEDERPHKIKKKKFDQLSDLHQAIVSAERRKGMKEQGEGSSLRTREEVRIGN